MRPRTRPSFQARLIVGFFPDKHGARLNIHRPFHFVKASSDRTKEALSDGLEDGMCVASISDVETRMGRVLHVSLKGCIGGHCEDDERLYIRRTSRANRRLGVRGGLGFKEEGGTK